MEEIKSKKKEKSEEKVMTFWDHLDELRKHIIRSIIAIIVLAIVAFMNREFVFDYVILGPSSSEFLTNRLLCKLGDFLSVNALCIDDMKLQIININMSGQFLTHMYISIVAGFIFSFPYILWEIWLFVKPAMHENERKYSQGGVFISTILFLMGILFSYYLIVPLTVNFLGTYQVSKEVLNQISLSSYISTVVSVTFAVGVVFELPILVYFLTKIGLLTPMFMKNNRKYMYIILLILSAIITPPDMFSQVLVVVPLIGLYELSIGVSNRIYKKTQMELE
ncbi:MAG: twin-arginine translocase subunit TatC [Marinilabiliales bacterium]|nr:MAG: twin-arginine translocase subunit TatC [Marinilabiliales bacterium]